MINAKLFDFHELMLWNFIQCLIKSDLKYLKKQKGFIKQSKLKEHWENIFSQYMNDSGDTSQIFLLSAIKEYTVLANKIKLVDGSLELLCLGFNKNIAENLKNMGFVVTDNDDYDKYIKSLKMTQTKAKSMVMRANKLKSEIDGFQENSGSSEIKESDFNEILLVLSKNQGYQITSKTITLVDFITLIKIYKDVERTENK